MYNIDRNLKIKQPDVIDLLIHFGYRQEAMSEKFLLFYNDKKDSIITFPKMSNREIFPEVIFSAVTVSMIGKGVAKEEEVDQYLNRRERRKLKRNKR